MTCPYYALACFTETGNVKTSVDLINKPSSEATSTRIRPSEQNKYYVHYSLQLWHTFYMRIYQGCWLVSGFINDWASFYDKKLSLLIVWIHNYLFRVIFVGVLHRQHKISDFSRNQISCEWYDLIKMCFVIFFKSVVKVDPHITMSFDSIWLFAFCHGGHGRMKTEDIVNKECLS